MANPYKKADNAKRVPPTRPQREELPVVPTVAEETSPVIETPVAAPAPEPSVNPLANMVEKKDARKTCSFTLSPDTIKKIEKLAKQNKCSKSMALDLLIQKYL